MTDTLNERILSAMDNLEVDSAPGGGGWIDSDSRIKAANEIEKLVLAEMYNLLVEMYNELPTGPLDRKITEIENQLNLIP